MSSIQQYIESLMKLAKYEHGEKTGHWCAYIEEFPGVYAQQKTVEETRKELEEMVREYILLNLANGLPLPNFNELSGLKDIFKKYAKIKTNKTAGTYA